MTPESPNHFGARFYNPSLGRFMTPDWSDTPEAIPYADLSNPATLNLYAYAKNNPVTNTDPDGHCCDPITTAMDIAVWAGLHPAAAARVAEGAKGVGMIAGVPSKLWAVPASAQPLRQKRHFELVGICEEQSGDEH